MRRQLLIGFLHALASLDDGVCPLRARKLCVLIHISESSHSSSSSLAGRPLVVAVQHKRILLARFRTPLIGSGCIALLIKPRQEWKEEALFRDKLGGSWTREGKTFRFIVILV